MPIASHLLKRIPIGTKYVLERRGMSVRRYIELPNGHRIRLSTRKALTCICADTSIVPKKLDLIERRKLVEDASLRTSA